VSVGGAERGAIPTRPRAGILVTGTEVLTGIISDRNGPWLSERLLDLGVDTEMIEIVGDRSDDLLAALRAMAAEDLALIVTSGCLGPTADDLTAEIVGRFSGRGMVLDPALETRIEEILSGLMRRWPNLDPEAIRTSNRKQAMIPEGATAIDPARYMHTGDIATMDADGYVNISGRIKDMVIRGGENVYPREIEEFLYTHPAIKDVQVIGGPDERYGEELCAWVIPHVGTTLSAEDVRD